MYIHMGTDVFLGSQHKYVTRSAIVEFLVNIVVSYM